jgi:hypothetical protein
MLRHPGGRTVIEHAAYHDMVPSDVIGSSPAPPLEGTEFEPSVPPRKRRRSREAPRPIIVVSQDDLCLMTPSSASVRHLPSATAERPFVRAGPMVRIRFPPVASPCKPAPPWWVSCQRPDDRPAASEIRCRGEVRQPRSAALPPGHQLVNRAEAGADLSNTQGSSCWSAWKACPTRARLRSSGCRSGRYARACRAAGKPFAS